MKKKMLIKKGEKGEKGREEFCHRQVEDALKEKQAHRA